MPNKSPLLEAITQSPLLISSGSEGLFQASIKHVIESQHADQMLGEALSVTAADGDDFWPTGQDDWRSRLRPYNVQNGVLQIPVMGVLLNRFSYQFGRWATGYTYIERALQRGLADSNVRAIAFVIDSPGGEVAGCFELSDKIYSARGEKPFRAFAADSAYSAAYAIASATDSITVTRSGGVGSIGVVTAHVEYSEMLKDVGIKVTFIYAGDHKVDGNSYEKLPDEVKSRIQERINRIYGEFTGTVARNRSMGEEAVRDTKALTYSAAEAIQIGLADRTGGLDEEMTIFSEELAEAKDEQMANGTEKKDGTAVDQAAHDAAVTEARIEGAAAERGRISAILSSPEGKTRPKAAMSLAMKTSMSIEEAQAVLSDMDEEKASTPTKTGEGEGETAKTPTGKKPKASGQTPFDNAMSKDNPEVGDGGGADDDVSDDDTASASILADYAGTTGVKRKSAA